MHQRPATQQRGTNFGYAARTSNGSTDIRAVIQGSATYSINPHWSVNGFLGLINGSDVTLGSLDGDTLAYRYVGRIPDFPVTRSHPLASWPSAANSSIGRTYRKTVGEESLQRSPVASR